PRAVGAVRTRLILGGASAPARPGGLSIVGWGAARRGSSPVLARMLRDVTRLARASARGEERRRPPPRAYATTTCSETVPTLSRFGEGRSVACLRAAEIAANK